MPTQNLDPNLIQEITAAFSIGGLLVFSPILRPWYSQWGATDSEASQPIPGDEIVPQPTLQSTRAITIQATPEKIWPWLVQLGQAKGGLYSYQRLENMAGCQIRNAGRIVPDWQAVGPGDLVRMGPPGYPVFTVTAADPERSLVLQACDPKTEQPAPASWAFLLVSKPDGTTRLLTRSRNSYLPSFANHLIWRVITDPLYFVMERQMLVGIQRRSQLVS